MFPQSQKISHFICTSCKHYTIFVSQIEKLPSVQPMNRQNSVLKMNTLLTHNEEVRDLFQAAISVDCVLFGYAGDELMVLTVNSELEEYHDLHSLVGGIIFNSETLEDAAARVLKTRTGLTNVPLEQIKTFGKPDRHPLGRVITIVFYAMVNMQDYQPDPTNGFHPVWTPARSIDRMAFDHKEILNECLEIIKHRFLDEALFAHLMPQKFTLSQLQQLFEHVMDTKLDKRNFRKKLLSTDHLVETDERQLNVNHRPAKLYQVRTKTTEKKT